MRFTLRRDSTSRRITLLSKNFKFRIEMIVDDTKLKKEQSNFKG